MSQPDAVAAILWIGITFYAVFGGADFGGGMWDLLAGRDQPESGRAGARPLTTVPGPRSTARSPRCGRRTTSG